MGHDGGHPCYLGLGSNLGDRWGHLATAVAALQADTHLEVVAKSGVYETSPVGGPAGQGRYLNAVVALRTSLAPGGLLEVCQRIERRLGRQRHEQYGPRTIDVDVLLYGDLVSPESSLTIPHPRMHQRRFVLEPLAEIAPDVVHPVLHRSIRQLLAGLASADAADQRCLRVAGADWDGAAVKPAVSPPVRTTGTRGHAGV